MPTRASMKENASPLAQLPDSVPRKKRTSAGSPVQPPPPPPPPVSTPSGEGLSPFMIPEDAPTPVAASPVAMRAREAMGDVTNSKAFWAVNAAFALLWASDMSLAMTCAWAGLFTIMVGAFGMLMGATAPLPRVCAKTVTAHADGFVRAANAVISLAERVVLCSNPIHALQALVALRAVTYASPNFSALSCFWAAFVGAVVIPRAYQKVAPYVPAVKKLAGAQFKCAAAHPRKCAPRQSGAPAHARAVAHAGAS